MTDVLKVKRSRQPQRVEWRAKLCIGWNAYGISIPPFLHTYCYAIDCLWAYAECRRMWRMFYFCYSMPFDLWCFTFRCVNEYERCHIHLSLFLYLFTHNRYTMDHRSKSLFKYFLFDWRHICVSWRIVQNHRNVAHSSLFCGKSPFWISILLLSFVHVVFSIIIL